MKYPEFSVGLEKLRIPVLITDGEGTVLYKNAAAMQRVRLPKRMTKIEPHLYHCPPLSSILEGVRPRLSERVSVDTGDRVMNALVSPYGRNKDQYVWIFLPLIQNNPSGTEYTQLEKALLDYSYEICDVVRCTEAFDRRKTDEVPASVKARIDRRTDAVLNGLLAKCCPCGENGLRDGYRTAISLCDTFARALSHLGCSVRFDRNALDPEKLKSSCVDALTFSMILSHVLHIALKSSGQNGISLAVTSDGETLGIDVVYTGLYAPFYTQKCDSFRKFARLSGEHAIEQEILSRLCASAECDFYFSVSADEIDNIRLHFGLPLVRRPGLQVPDTVADLLFERDSVLYLLALFE